MLDPHDRRLLHESLRPPEGFRLDRAIGTTYSLDLVALLLAPLAFASFEAANEEDGRPPNPIALLRALRSQADRILVFCQGGQIRIPPRHQPLLAHLEHSVVQALAPGGGAFHPKVWVLRFRDGEQVAYRLLCLSRNLTFDRSWDTILQLDGELRQRATAIAANRPLCDFVASLAEMARPALPEARSRLVLEVAEELGRVRFEPIEDIEVRFWPLGVAGRRSWPFPERIDRALVVAPFVDEPTLARLTPAPGAHVLVSRIEELQALAPACRARFRHSYYLDEAAAAGPVEAAPSPGAEGEVPPDPPADLDTGLAGLHAKAFLVESGHRATLWVGSANATRAAFERNVEFLIELAGTRAQVGIETVLGGGSSGISLLALLSELPRSSEVVPADESALRLDEKLRAARLALVEAGYRAVVEATEPGEFRLTLRCGGTRPPALDGIVRASLWPITLPERARHELSLPLPADIELPGRLSFESLTAFFAFEVVARDGRHLATSRFVLTLPLDGAPADRQDRILASILSDRDKVLLFLLVLLAAEGDPGPLAEALARPPGDARAPAAGPLGRGALLESLLRTLDRDPERLDEVKSVLDGLREAGAGDRLPPGLDDIWTPVWKVREEQRR